MLTIRLNQNGTLSAVQTNRIVTLLKAADEAYKEIMHLIPVDQPGDVVFENEVATVLSERADRTISPSAALRLTPHLESGQHEALDDARVICLYDGDDVKVIDSGAILFEWPKGAA